MAARPVRLEVTAPARDTATTSATRSPKDVLRTSAPSRAESSPTQTPEPDQEQKQEHDRFKSARHGYDSLWVAALTGKLGTRAGADDEAVVVLENPALQVFEKKAKTAY